MRRTEQRKSARATAGNRPLASAPFVPRDNRQHLLITGGAGFIGTNLSHRLLSEGHRVLIFDNLSRPGSEANLSWLMARHGSRVSFEQGDIRDPDALQRSVRHACAVFHFAAQVAVTGSLTNPRNDFDVNARGTLELLEAIRLAWNPPALLFTSTNKVYGALPDIELRNNGRQYSPKRWPILKHGISESRSLDFCSPYGCSKGAADQYVLDYARSFHIRTVVFRMSCIYGPHQNGTEDQGWVAHFLMRANQRSAIRIFGDGMQVRDLLFVDDLVEAFLRAASHIESAAGNAFNIGGGVQNTISLLDLLEILEQARGEPCRVEYGAWRHGDQRYYVSDTRKFGSLTGWAPRIGVRDGLEILQNWLTNRKESGFAVAPESLHEHPAAVRDTIATAS